MGKTETLWWFVETLFVGGRWFDVGESILGKDLVNKTFEGPFMILDDVLRFFLNVIKESTWLDDPSQESMKELTTGQWTGTGCSGSATFRIDGLIWPAPVGLSRSDGDVEDANGSDPGSCQIMSKCRWQDSQGWGGRRGKGGGFLRLLEDLWRVLGIPEGFLVIFQGSSVTRTEHLEDSSGSDWIIQDSRGLVGISQGLSCWSCRILQDAQRSWGRGGGNNGILKDFSRIVRGLSGIMMEFFKHAPGFLGDYLGSSRFIQDRWTLFRILKGSSRGILRDPHESFYIANYYNFFFCYRILETLLKLFKDSNKDEGSQWPSSMPS